MDKIDELLTRGVDSIYPSKKSLEEILRKGKKLKLYQGFDPTGIQLHVGHMVGLMKLKQWQDLGHKVIFLIGDGTGQAGDPSGKTKSRETFFTTEQLRKNATNYVKQAAGIVNFEGDNPVEILYNGDWLNKLNLTDILNIAEHFSLQQMIERDLFQERLKQNETVNLREFFYPLLQGYDSVEMKIDLEVGGSDQTFNMLCGRTLVKEMLGKEKFVMTTPLLTDSEGKKIGKTEGNVIAITDNPSDLFGKIMSLPDSIIIKGFEYLTFVDMKEIGTIKEALNKGKHPMEYKKQLAYEIVKQLNNEKKANEAKSLFEKIIQNKEPPNDIISFPKKQAFKEGTGLIEVLISTNLAKSKTDAKRLIQQGGVEINSQKIKETTYNVNFENGMVIKVGKRNFIRILND